MLNLLAPKRYIKHQGRKLYIEHLPDDFVVYKRRESHQWFYQYTDGIEAKNAATDCCDAEPVKYFPDAPQECKRWWLICISCKHAIKANGDVA